MPRVECPKCEQIVEVEAEAFGHLTECPYCQATFPAVESTAEEADEPGESFNARIYFSASYLPADPFERAAIIREAERRVWVPAIGLIVTGLLGIAASAIIGLWAVIESMGRLQRGRGDTEFVIMQMGATIAVCFYCFLIAAGGRQMRLLETRGLAIAAATLAVFSTMFCGIWIVLSIPGLIFGTWAFAALNSREVRHAMRWKRREREERRWE